LWGHFEDDDDERELLEAVRTRLHSTSEAKEKPLPADAETTASTELSEIVPER
jgi:hypothetical protein